MPLLEVKSKPMDDTEVIKPKVILKENTVEKPQSARPPVRNNIISN